MDIFEEITELTDDNFHTEAWILAAQYVGANDQAERLRWNLSRHEIIGEMTDELSENRTKLCEEIENHAKQVLSMDEFAELMGCF